MSKKNVTVSVTLPGQGKVTVELEDGSTVADTITAAAVQLGVVTQINLESLGIVVDSMVAEPDDEVADGANVAVAPRVANG